jgi:hypothetical protein
MPKYRKRMTGNYAEKIPMENVDEGLLASLILVLVIWIEGVLPAVFSYCIGCGKIL